MATSIPVIDLFAGPGGLAEGFASLRDRNGNPCFDIRLSIEKEASAHRTLELRAFARSFGGKLPKEYYDYLKGKIDRNSLFLNEKFKAHREHAQNEAWHLELSEDTHEIVRNRVRKALGNADHWVLIGGPPCQAYSLVGRSRMRSGDPGLFEKDKRHFLYKQYLKIIADHRPPVFVMENVKGMLSSTIGGKLIFEKILADLQNPDGKKLRYRIVSLCEPGSLFGHEPEDYIIRAERYGIPQARHRVILCGIREDIDAIPGLLNPGAAVSVLDALHGMPPLRSRLSDKSDTAAVWHQALAEGALMLKRQGGREFRDIATRMAKAVRQAASLSDTGGRFVPVASAAEKAPKIARNLHAWYRDSRLHGLPNHEARGHMKSDLWRYLFAAAYAEVRNTPPKLRDFPKFLLPDHGNAHGDAEETPFEDRFRVQIGNRPSTTVVSHIAKDGHYYIHPDPAQCRSLSVREAARLQTFPDNYFFEGNRTEQYTQVGNAVPPLLARQIAEIVLGIIR